MIRPITENKATTIARFLRKAQEIENWLNGAKDFIEELRTVRPRDVLETINNAESDLTHVKEEAVALIEDLDSLYNSIENNQGYDND